MLVVVASRGRPRSLHRLMPSLAIPARVIVRLDEDDPTLDDYRLIALPDNVEVVIGSRVKAAGAQEEAFRRYPSEDCYGFVGDDTRIKTDGWSETLRAAAGDWHIAYPDDLLKGEDQATHPFIGGEFLRAIGFWALPGLVHLYTDTVWDFLGRQYGNLVYRPDVVLEHLHWSVGKSPVDDTYQRVFQGRNHGEEDRECFLRWSQSYLRQPGVMSRIAASAARARSKSPVSDGLP